MEDDNRLVLGQSDFFNGISSSRIRGAKPSQLEVLGTRVSVRDVRDCPDVTSGHYVLGSFLSNKGFEHGCFVLGDYIDGLGQDYISSKVNVVDLGCGTGFLGNHLANNYSIPNLIFSDLSADSLRLAKDSWNLNSSVRGSDSNVSFREGDAARTLGDIDGGIAVCSPYLIPGVCTVFPGVYDLFAGVAKRQNLDLYIAHSNLSEELVNRAAALNGLDVLAVFRENNLKLRPEYSCGRIQSQVDQMANGKLFPEVADALRVYGLREDDKGNYVHDIIVSRLSNRV